MKVLKNLRDRIQPNKLYEVKISIYNEAVEKNVGSVVVTTMARTKGDAMKNCQTFLRLHINEAWAVKDKRNGTKR